MNDSSPSPQTSPSKLPRVLFAVIAVGILFWAYQQWNSEERRLARRLDALRELVEKGSGEGDLEAVSRARTLGDFFARQFEVKGEPFGSFNDRQRMGQLFVQYRRRSENVGVGFSDQQIQILDAGSRKVGEVGLVATLTGRTGTEVRRESYRLVFLWKKEEGEWVIERMELLEVLEGNPLF